MLQTKHLFPFLRLMKKLDLKQELKKLLSDRVDTAGKTEEEIDAIQKEKGVDVAFLLVEKLPDAEEEFYDFFALYTGRSEEELKQQGLGETVDMIMNLFQDKSFKVFFEQAAK